ncbi:ribonuclease H-like domain-containing protein [Rhizophagus irregularis DAOM 181602=DAOM 197198]|nr:ribonuclease H-like domain-containing protein [Rhizophagus irregularis DAOM 181602=DAOM 197198]
MPDIQYHHRYIGTRYVPDRIDFDQCYKRDIIHDWSSSSRAEAAAIYAALSASPANSVVHIYTDSQSSIEGLKHCLLSDYSDSRLYYKTTNFELWAIIQQLIVDKQLSVLPFKVKAHSNFYWNDFADSLANTAHTSDDAVLISRLDLAAVYDYIMIYDDVICESNPRHLFKRYHRMLYMKDLLALFRFHFISLLTDPSRYMVDWALTWHTLMFQPKFDNSFTKENVSRHHTLKFQLFLEDLPTLELLKRTRPDLYVEILTCRSCEDHLEDFMHLFLCKKRRVKLHQILTSYIHHLTQKIKEAGDNANCDYSPLVDRITSLPCWTFSSSNWSSYSLVCGCLPAAFLEVFESLGIPRLTAMNVVTAIHNNFVNKFRKRIWNPRSHDKGLWEHAMNITSTLKQSSRPKGLSKSFYLPYSSLPPLTHVDSRDSGTDWLKNLMQYELCWFNHILGFMGCLTVLLNNCFCRMECRL